jgi:hypothetical protein
MVEERGGLKHGIRAEIARELGVSRSTVSRDIAARYYAPREPRPSGGELSAKELIASLGPFGEQLAARDCQCEGEVEEPRHALGHVVKQVAETLDAVEDGRLSLPVEDVRVLKRVRDGTVSLLRR